MKNNVKRGIVIGLFFFFVQTIMAVVDSGTYGKNIHWTFDRTSGVLTLSGKGEMTSDSNVPKDWDNFNLKVKKIIITNGITSISDRAFKNCRNTTDISIPPSVKKIGRDVLDGCNSLSGIYITDLSAWCRMEMQTLPLNRAKKLFVNGKILTDLVIPNDITYLGLCFKNCTSITSVTIPKNMKKMHSSAFEGCTNLTHVIWNAKDVVSQTDYYYSPLYYLKSQLTNITFGNEVQAIQSQLCYNMEKLESVVIPDGVITIGDEAFYGCTSLSSVTIAPSVRNIGRYVFKQCTNLSAIYISDLSAWCKIEYPAYDTYTLPKNRKSIELKDISKDHLPLYYAHNLYLNGKLLTDLQIPKEITALGSAFRYCNCIRSVTLHENIQWMQLNSFEKCSKLSTVVWNVKNYAYDAPWTYENKETIKSFTFGPNVEVIPTNCCGGMDKISSISIPASVKIIQSGAFNECRNLSAVHIEDLMSWITMTQKSHPLLYAGKLYLNGKLVTDISWPKTIKQVGDAFRFCTSLKSVVIPDGVVKIEDKAFENCKNLQKVIIPQTIQTIGEKAFSGCIGLMQIDIPNTIQSIGYYAFEDVPNLEYYSSRISGAPWGARSLNGTVLDGVVYADENAITLCACPSTYKGNITIPSSVREINSNAFLNCDSLTAVRIEDLKNWLQIDFKNKNANPLMYAHKLIIRDSLVKELHMPIVKSIPAYAFVNCTSLEKVIIPHGVNNIGSYAFNGCTNLVAILPENVSSARYAFDNVPYVIKGGYLEDGIVYNDKSKTIIKKCLSYVKGNVVIPSTVTKIKEYAFSGCSLITSVTIPPSLAEVGKSAFYNCNRLHAVHITDMKKWCSIDFHDAKSNPMYYANQIFLEGTLLQHVSIPDDVKEIKARTFWNCQSLVSVRLHEGITSIGWSAFYNCTHLEHINLPQSMTAIGSYAFDQCRSLRSIVLPPNVVKIPNGTFEFCSGLNSVVLSSKTTTIGERSFYLCDNLQQILLPETITEIGDNAFAFCTALSSVKIPNTITKIGKDAFNYVRDVRYSGSLSGAPWSAKAINGYVDGDFVYSDASKTELLACSSNVQGDIFIPQNVTKIHSNAFHHCRNIFSLHVPETVTEIGNWAFYMIPNVIYSGPASGSPWGALGVNGYINKPFIFKDSSQQELVACSSTITGDIIIPEGVVSIGESAFESCQLIRSVSFPQSLKLIKNRAFADCGLLEEVMFSKGIKTIQVDSTALYLCYSLQKVVIPEGLSISSTFNDYTKIYRIPKDSSHLEIMTYSLYEPNGNGIIDVDEPCEIRFYLHNTGKGDAVGCKVKIEMENDVPFLHVDKEMLLPDILAGDSIHVKLPIYTDKNAKAVSLPIQLSITEVQGNGIAPVTIPIHLTTFAPPQLQAEFNLFSSSTFAQRTEPLTVKMILHNVEKGIARDVSCSVALPNALQHLSGKLQQKWDVIYSGEQKEFSFKINSSEQTPDSLSLDYVLKEKYGLYSNPGYIPIVWNKTETHKKEINNDLIYSVSEIEQHPVALVSGVRPDWCEKNPVIKDKYALIRINLVGNKEMKQQAKRDLRWPKERINTVPLKMDFDIDNSIYLLVPVSCQWCDLSCGDGCEPLQIWNFNHDLVPNGVYDVSITITHL